MAEEREMTPSEVAERTRTELTHMCDLLAEGALQGKVKGALIVRYDADGGVNVSHVGVSMSEALGGAQIAQEYIIRGIRMQITGLER